MSHQIQFRGGEIAVKHLENKEGTPPLVGIQFQALKDKVAAGDSLIPGEHEMIGDPISLLFYNPESARVVIKALIRARKKLVKKLADTTQHVEKPTQ